MAPRQTENPEQLLAEIRANRPAQSPEDVSKQWNLIERLFATVDPSTDVERAMLEALNELVELQGGATGDLSNESVQQLLQRQVRGQMDTRNLPIGQFGYAVEDIPTSESGTAFFKTWAGEFATEVRASQEIEKDDPVVIVGPANQARVEDDIADVRDQIESVPRMDPRATINVANQDYTFDGDFDEIKSELVTADGDLEAGDEEVMVQVVSEVSDFPIDINRVGMTSHKADIDNDANTADQSIVRYHFEYQFFGDDEWTEFPWSPTVLPRGDMRVPAPIVTDHLTGPMKGMRIRFENRTDEGTFTNSKVNAEDMGALLEGRIVT